LTALGAHAAGFAAARRCLRFLVGIVWYCILCVFISISVAVWPFVAYLK